MIYETIVDKESDGDILNKYVNNYHLPITEDIDVNNKTFWDKGDDKLDKCDDYYYFIQKCINNKTFSDKEYNICDI